MKLTTLQVEEAIKMYQMGLSLGPIAKYYNVSRQALWSLLKRRIQLRPQHANRKTYDLLEIAIQKGIITRKSKCEICNSKNNIQPHHDNYNKPLDVTWICRKCHDNWHKHNVARKLVIRKEAS